MKLSQLLFCLISTFVFAQNKNLLQSGPMLGYSEMKEVLIWAQTTQEAEVYIKYKKKGTNVYFQSDKIKTSKNNGYTAKLLADNVTEGTEYEYDLFINNKKVSVNYPTVFQTKKLWQWRTDAPDFSVALGSCNYINEPELDRPGKGYGDNYEIFTSINAKKPNIMLWLGDNTYLREADWDTRNGIYHRYTHSRSVKEIQPLLASAINLAIWDDHDFGPNDGDRSFINKHITQQAFKDFWGNKFYGLDKNQEQGVCSMYSWSDVDFFLLDDRFFKSPNNRKTGERTILGKEQLEWLLDALSNSKATFKLICIGGQVLNSADVFENYATYKEEREYLLNQIKENNIRGVLFLTGDRHHSELSALKRDGTYTLYDWTVSPLTSGVSKSGAKENNTNRVEGSYFTERNFGMIHFSGNKENRQMKLVLHNVNGEPLWEKVISAKELK